MQRIVIVGPSGAGKSTLAREIARLKEIPCIEMDSLHWGADWTATPSDELRVLVAERVAAHSWVLDGNYSVVRDLIWPRADTLIWLDYAFPVVFMRAMKRTLRRLVQQEELWNGNRETWKSTFSRDSVMRWVFITYGKCRHTIPLALAQIEFAHLNVVHLRSPREARLWLKRLKRSSNRCHSKTN